MLDRARAGCACIGGRPTNLDNSRARAYCVCSRCGWGCLDIFFSRLSFLFSFFLSLGWMDGWMGEWMTRDFTSISAEFHLYQDAGWVMDGCVQWKHV